ncbi:MAG: hypothetical protein GHCLOJNM_01038 [bacterium]|nr:hypothetical protein [bacterium]
MKTDHWFAGCVGHIRWKEFGFDRHRHRSLNEVRPDGGCAPISDVLRTGHSNDEGKISPLRPREGHRVSPVGRGSQRSIILVGDPIPVVIQPRQLVPAVEGLDEGFPGVVALLNILAHIGRAEKLPGERGVLRRRQQQGGVRGRAANQDAFLAESGLAGFPECRGIREIGHGCDEQATAGLECIQLGVQISSRVGLGVRKSQESVRAHLLRRANQIQQQAVRIRRPSESIVQTGRRGSRIHVVEAVPIGILVGPG